MKIYQLSIPFEVRAENAEDALNEENIDALFFDMDSTKNLLEYESGHDPADYIQVKEIGDACPVCSILMENGICPDVDYHEKENEAVNHEIITEDNLTDMFGEGDKEEVKEYFENPLHF